MISTADFRNGMVIVVDNQLMEIVDFQHVKPGKGGAFVRTKLKNILSGRVLEKTYRAGERMEEARVEEQTWEYLYNDGDVFHFMDSKTYEQIGVNKDIIGDGADWLKENMNAKLLFHDGKVISFEPPLFVELTITQTDPGVQGDRATGGTKPATLETGATIQVPLFLNEGDVVKVDTRTAEYLERVS
ncbi:MAG TPA: elongation factor P [Candidatus Hydrogenedentes bacterium]|nr:elongation factor P [Candidatus Hydrogenedentota bacterium]